MINIFLKASEPPFPGAQLVRASSQCTKVAGLIPSKGTYKKQHKKVEHQIKVSLFLPSSLPLCLPVLLLPSLKSLKNI